jgi:hypothetical protein
VNWSSSSPSSSFLSFMIPFCGAQWHRSGPGHKCIYPFRLNTIAKVEQTCMKDQPFSSSIGLRSCIVVSSDGGGGAFLFVPSVAICPPLPSFHLRRVQRGRIVRQTGASCVKGLLKASDACQRLATPLRNKDEKWLEIPSRPRSNGPKSLWLL